jgi:hypothetical protein
MIGFLATLLITIVLGGIAWGQNKCDRPDSNFGEFLSRFKNNASFRESRLITPLQYSLTEPEKTTKELLSLEQIHTRKLQIICDNACAARLKGTEGQLCEEGPKVKGNRAEFVQYSCGTDVYGYTYHFVRKDGCWFLQGLDVSGG